MTAPPPTDREIAERIAARFVEHAGLNHVAGRTGYVERFANEIERTLRRQSYRRDAMTDWQPIDSAPKDGTPVLVVNPHSCCGLLIAQWQTSPDNEHEKVWCVTWDGTEIGMQPTYWQPLPPPPTCGEEA